MKIVEVSAFEVEGILNKPWKIATATMQSINSVVVRIVTDTGIVGYGEACARGGTSATKAVVDELLRPVLLGQNPMRIEALWEEMFATLRARGHTRGFLLEAMSGADIALWDIAGRATGVPIKRLLMAYNRDQVPAYASSVLLDEPAAMAADAKKLVDDGYSAVKVKISGDVTKDVERVETIRDAVGLQGMIMLDANSSYDPPDCVGLSEKLKGSDVYWLEEPLFLDDLAGYRRLRQTCGLRIALGEGEFTAGGFLSFLQEGLVDVVQPNVTRAGGITGVRRIAAVAQTFGIPIALHTGASGPICMATTLQLAGALPGFLMHEHMYLENPFGSFFESDLPKPSAGFIKIPDGPGLGVDVNEKAFESYVRRSGYVRPSGGSEEPRLQSH